MGSQRRIELEGVGVHNEDLDIGSTVSHGAIGLAWSAPVRRTNLRHTSHRASGELVDEGKGLLVFGHDGGGEESGWDGKNGEGRGKGGGQLGRGEEG